MGVENLYPTPKPHVLFDLVDGRLYEITLVMFFLSDGNLGFLDKPKEYFYFDDELLMCSNEVTYPPSREDSIIEAIKLN